MIGSMGRDRAVIVVVYDGCALLDVAGPTEVFHVATLLSNDGGYRVVLASPDGRPVRTENGITLGVDAALGDLVEAGPDFCDTLLIVGGLAADTIVARPEVLADLRILSARSERTASVCTGALILAAAGLLDGYRATTHWSACPQLADGHPPVTVEPDRIYVHDRDRWTSAGVTAGTDLALALVEGDLGTEVAHQVAGWLVVFVRRPGGQAQFSAQLKGEPARSPSLVALQRWLPDNLSEDLSVAAVAKRIGMSERHFARVFRDEVGTTPASFIEGLRIESARRLLETTNLTVAAVSAAVGLHQAETLHRAFLRRVGTTPARYREHFHRHAS